ncbi:MAG: hypothetical protein CFE34_15115 [Rhodobacteraceae bacterium PARR1]|nr:MAG: hypothetical protein CFE34_15115 [Rhodobacteraceae bacterium PARR1]
MSPENQNSTTESLSQTARSAAEGLKETGAQAVAGAKSVMDSAMTDLKAGASAKADEMRGSIAEEGQRMASSLRDAAGQGGGVQARVLETVASGVEAVSDQIATRDVSGIMHDVTAFARRNPAVFVAGAAVAGLVLARLAAQAGRPQQPERTYADYDRRGTQAGDMGAGYAARGMADDLGTEFGSGSGPTMGAGPSMGGNQ